MDEKIAILNQMIENYNSSYGHALMKIKGEDDIDVVVSSLKQQVGQLANIIEYIEYEIETE